MTRLWPLPIFSEAPAAGTVSVVTCPVDYTEPPSHRCLCGLPGPFREPASMNNFHPTSGAKQWCIPVPSGAVITAELHPATSGPPYASWWRWASPRGCRRFARLPSRPGPERVARRLSETREESRRGPPKDQRATKYPNHKRTRRHSRNDVDIRPGWRRSGCDGGPDLSGERTGKTDARSGAGRLPPAQSALPRAREGPGDVRPPPPHPPLLSPLARPLPPWINGIVLVTTVSRPDAEQEGTR